MGETSGRCSLPEPVSTRSWSYQPTPRSHHRSYSAGVAASTIRPEINYGKLKELCGQFPPRERIDHEAFMKVYPSILISQPKQPHYSRPHTSALALPRKREVSFEQASTSHNIRPFMKAIHGRTEEEQKHYELSISLQTILGIVKKLPIQRSGQEVKTLSQQLKQVLSFIPYDKTVTKEDFFNGLAERAILEHLPAAGYSLPQKGGFYLILKGRVEKLDLSKEVCTIMHPGCTFGDIDPPEESTLHKAMSITRVNTYPTYSSKEEAMLLRINGADYRRIIQGCKKDYIEERHKLVTSCNLLFAVSPSILNNLAKAVVMEKLDPNTVVVTEGQPITKLYFIQKGRCKATATVPGSLTERAQLVVGELGPGDCIGEVFLHSSTEIQPYTITTITETKVGTITCPFIKSTDVEKHILSDRVTTLPSLTGVQIRTMYVRRAMDKQWNKIKEHVKDEVAIERGIEFGQKKWKHSQSKPS